MTPDEIYPIFIKWYSMPPETRDPRNIPEFSEKMNISLAQIAEFTNKDTFSEDLFKAAKEWGKSKIPELLHMLYRKYKEKQNPNDLRMYKELLELDKNDKTVGNTINFNVFNPTDEQYKQIIARESRSLALGESETPLVEDSSTE